MWHILSMGDYICTKCRNIGKPKKKKRGSLKTEFFCWMLFPFGVPYTIWRMATKINVCRYCDEQFLISVTSPSGKRLAQLMSANDEEEGLALPHKPAPAIEKAPSYPPQELVNPRRKPQDPDIW